MRGMRRTVEVVSTFATGHESAALPSATAASACCRRGRRVRVAALLAHLADLPTPEKQTTFGSNSTVSGQSGVPHHR